MKLKLLSLLLFPFVSVCNAQNGPTMGWSSWNTYGVNINEDLIKRQADAMVSKGFLAVGYDHINIDDGFFGGRNTDTGELLIHPTRFPNGLKVVADYIHSKGLKAGIYSDAGANTCGNMYNGDDLSVNVGLYNYDDRDANFYFNECGFDFIKVDFCGGDAPQNKQHLALDPQERYTAIANAIKRTGRDDVRLNVCRWNYPGTWVHDVAFSWRTTHDIYDGWASVKGILAENLYLSAYSYDGRFNDMDMLEVGRSMTTEEDKTHFGMWCIMNSPLLIGCDLTTVKSTAMKLLQNKELIALNQDPLYQQAYLVNYVNGCYVLVRDLEEREGLKRAFAIYNPTDEQQKVEFDFSDLCLGGNISIRDVFNQKDLRDREGTFTTYLPAHGTKIFVATGEYRLERVRYEAETGYISDYQELKNNQSEQTGIYSADANCSSGYKAGWLGMKAENDLLWRDVFSRYGGEYSLTIGYISGENRNIDVSVNGKKVKTLSVNSGGWSTVGTTSLNVTLNQGLNEVRLSNSSAWMPDIDYIDLVCTSLPSDISEIKKEAVNNDLAYDLSGCPASLSSRIIIKNGIKYLNK